jgi:hypothetical protein
MKLIYFICGFLLFPGLAFHAFSDTIYLKNGTIIEVGETWEEDGKIWCYRFSNKVGYLKKDVKRVDKKRGDGSSKRGPNPQDEGSKSETTADDNFPNFLSPPGVQWSERKTLYSGKVKETPATIVDEDLEPGETYRYNIYMTDKNGVRHLIRTEEITVPKE